MSLLNGVRVIEVSQVLAGPFAATILGDMGAEVVKVERPGGEIVRNNQPQMGGISAYFTAANRNKEYITLNLKDEDAQSAFRRLAAEADVVIENLKPRTMKRFNLGPEVLFEDNEDLIYCSINGFAEGSEYESLPSWDFMTQAMSGAMSITGEKVGAPVRTGVPIGDIAASMYAVQAVLVGLYARDIGGAGPNKIEIPMLDSLISWLTVRAGYSFATGEPYPRGNKHPEFSPWELFETKDSYLVIAVGSEPLWPKLCRAIGREDLVDDERFYDNEHRLEYETELFDILNEELGQKTTDEWFDVMREYGVPAAPVYDTIDMWEDEYLNDRHLRVSIGSEEPGGTIDLLRNPVVFDDESLSISTPPKPIGSDTVEVLSSMGYSKEEIERLKQKGAI